MSAPPEECPGVGTEASGKVDACAGCPNQKICASGEVPPVDPDIAIIAAKLSSIKHIIVVASGKGGVGKSSVSTQLSYYLASQGHDVGLLDIDICGPSVPTLTGTKNAQVHESAQGWQPVWVDDNMCVMSIGFLLPNSDDPIIWRGPRKNGMIKTFLKDVFWGPLDYLIIDTPPGTSDEHLSILAFLSEAGIDGAIIVTTPQEVALADVRKEINFFRKTGIKLIGVVENMSGFVCPCCNNETTIFHPTSGGAEPMCKNMDAPYLGRIPLDPMLTKACDTGKSWKDCLGDTDSAGYNMFAKVVANFKNQIDV